LKPSAEVQKSLERLTLEDESTTIFRNVGNSSPKDTRHSCQLLIGTHNPAWPQRHIRMSVSYYR